MIYSKIANAQNKVTQTVTKYIQDFLPFLILLLNIIIVVGSSLFQAWLENPFTTDYFKSLFTNIATTMVAYCCFIKYGETNEKLNLENYEANHNSWTNLAEEVRKKHLERFNAYIKEQVILEREEKKHSIVANHTMIPIEMYDEVYRKMSKKEIKELVKTDALSKEDAYWIIKANRANKIHPVNPLLILGGIRANTINDSVRESKVSDSAKKIMGRPFVVFLTSALIAMLKGTWVGFGDASAIFDIIWSIFMIVISSMMGYSSGAMNARKELDRIKGRILYLERFLNNKGQSV